MVVLVEVFGGIRAIFALVLDVLKALIGHKKEKREAKIRASQNLVKAEYRTDRSEPRRLTHDLYLINTDTRSVAEGHVDLVTDDSERVVPKDFGSLGPGQEVRIDQFVVDRLHTRKRYKSAKFTYTDSDGHEHNYEQDTIPLLP